MTAPRLALAPTPRLAVSTLPPRPPSGGFAESLAQQAMAWHMPDRTESDLSQAITWSAIDLIPGAQGAAILVLSGPSQLTVRAAQGTLPDFVTSVDAESDPWPPKTSGPRAPNRASTFTDLPSASWPVFSSPATSTDDSMICTPLGSGSVMFGTLVVASSPQDRFGATIPAMVTALAMHAPIALATARDRAGRKDAIASRDLIGQAKGVLMERRRITADTAFAELIQLSQAHNVKIRDICRQIASGAEFPVQRGSSHEKDSIRQRL